MWNKDRISQLLLRCRFTGNNLLDKDNNVLEVAQL